MATYPNTALADGQVDPPFGGQKANAFGAPMRTFIDAQNREAQKQIVNSLWSGRPVQNLVIADGGLAGDAIVFDTTGNNLDGSPVYRPLKNVTYDPDVYPIVGILLVPVSAAAKGTVCTGGGHLVQSVSGVAVGLNGPATIDTTTGRLRRRATGETTNGFIDLSGNCFLLSLGVLP